MCKAIRVLNVVGEMSPGGIETLIMNLYRNIDRNKVQFDFLMHSPDGNGSFVPEIKELGGKVFRTPIIKTKEKTYYYRLFSYIFYLAVFFQKHPEYHIVHGHMTNLASIYMPISKSFGKVTCCIAHSHLTEARPGLSGIVTNILHKPLPMIATDFFACSEMAAHWIYSERDITSGKVIILKNGVDPKKFYFNQEKYHKVRNELKLAGKLVIGNVARFKPEKNHEFQIDIFYEIIKREPNSVLLLIGEGELMPMIKQKVKSLGIENSVLFMGVRSDIPDLMTAMDVFLLPSLYEGLPVVGVEAQASGLPVVTSTGVTNEVDITGNVTFIDLKESATFWADKIINIVKNFKRHNMYNYIQKNGYDITETAKWLQEFYINKHFK